MMSEPWSLLERAANSFSSFCSTSPTASLSPSDHSEGRQPTAGIATSALNQYYQDCRSHYLPASPQGVEMLMNREAGWLGVGVGLALGLGVTGCREYTVNGHYHRHRCQLALNSVVRHCLTWHLSRQPHHVAGHAFPQSTLMRRFKRKLYERCCYFKHCAKPGPVHLLRLVAFGTSGAKNVAPAVNRRRAAAEAVGFVHRSGKVNAYSSYDPLEELVHPAKFATVDRVLYRSGFAVGYSDTIKGPLWASYLVGPTALKLASHTSTVARNKLQETKDNTTAFHRKKKDLNGRGELGAGCDSGDTKRKPLFFSTKAWSRKKKRGGAPLGAGTTKKPAFSSSPSYGKNAFAVDKCVPKSARRKGESFTGTGYDRGHLAPRASVGFSPQSTQESYLLSNVILQDSTLNRGLWKELENLVRHWARRHAAKETNVRLVTNSLLSSAVNYNPSPSGGTGTGTGTAGGSNSQTGSKQQRAALPLPCLRELLVSCLPLAGGTGIGSSRSPRSFFSSLFTHGAQCYTGGRRHAAIPDKGVTAPSLAVCVGPVFFNATMPRRVDGIVVPDMIFMAVQHLGTGHGAGWLLPNFTTAEQAQMIRNPAKFLSAQEEDLGRRTAIVGGVAAPTTSAGTSRGARTGPSCASTTSGGHGVSGWNSPGSLGTTTKAGASHEQRRRFASSPHSDTNSRTGTGSGKRLVVDTYQRRMQVANAHHKYLSKRILSIDGLEDRVQELTGCSDFRLFRELPPEFVVPLHSPLRQHADPQFWTLPHEGYVYVPPGHAKRTRWWLSSSSNAFPFWKKTKTGSGPGPATAAAPPKAQQRKTQKKQSGGWTAGSRKKKSTGKKGKKKKESFSSTSSPAKKKKQWN